MQTRLMVGVIAAAWTSAAPGFATPATPTRYPTVLAAGAKTCTLGESVVLGPRSDGNTVLVFGSAGGLAAWNQVKSRLALQPIGFAGTLDGAPSTVVIPEGSEPHLAYAVGDRFVVLLRRWNWQRKDLNWWGLVVDRAGHPAGPPALIGLADFDVWVGQALDDHRLGLLVGPGQISQDRTRPARWQTLVVGANGTLASTPVAVDLHDLDGSDFEPAMLAGKAGWIAVHDGVRRRDGVFDGTRAEAATAIPLRPGDAIAATVYNGAVPPPAAAGGKIYEPIAEATFERRRDGNRIGEPLSLDSDRGTIATTMYINDYVVWSGTHFLYPFRADGAHAEVERVLPIDCRP